MFVINSECREGMKKYITDNSIDAVICDPPYGLSKQPDMNEVLKHWLAGDDYTHNGSGFMGKSWDSFVPGPATWREAFRCLKPGGYALVFAGARTQDLMTTSLRLAGFEIRDSIMWLYSTGFPKSLNLNKLKGIKTCGCMVRSDHEDTEPKTKHELRPVRSPDIPPSVDSENKQREVLQPSMSEQSASAKRREQLSPPEIRGKQSRMEGGRDIPTTEGELCIGEICQSAERCGVNDEERRICHGAPSNNGPVDGAHVTSQRSSTSHRSQPSEQCTGEPGTMARQQEPQTLGAWPVCPGCGLPRIPDGYGTAIKPAYEPIIIARKPLEGTVADNVLKYGTGAVNIEGCRVGGVGGRWPANIMHDGSDDVLDAFPDAGGARIEDSKSAARFFYCAKASTADREAGLESFEALKQQDESRKEGDPGGDNPRNRGARERKNHHPTVKPTELMRWLCRLVGHPGAMIMDPFAGSGSTGRGALLEGFNFIGFEDDPDCCKIADARILNTIC